ncbi:jg22211 [Pararge aegeria aegeria]|uniref:Jg22211 protein n=1 Tax=Pararge aegeria aegeria TaxID=348720 RepID=A0A8S4QHJ9_9NEOP|nr:jg22211 [Pararge aegeria aegeria]
MCSDAMSRSNRLDFGADSQGSTQQQGAPLAASEAPACDQLKKSEIKIPPEISAKAAEWTSHRAPDGRPYYYHSASRHSVWEKPIPIKALEGKYQFQLTADPDLLS